MNQIYFNFYNEFVCVQSFWSEILILLEKDFSLFLTTKEIFEQNLSHKFLSLEIQKTNPMDYPIPEMTSQMQSLNSITYQENSVRYNDYYGKLLSIFDYLHETAKLISLDIEKSHEVAYLLILSRIGKRLDLKRLHKLHAFAISYKGLAFVCMMPMKGGKSTLLVELLKNDSVKMISDDIPLIDRMGRVLSFPLKIGMEPNTLIGFPITSPEDNIYHLKRENFGQKTFICLNGLAHKIEKPGAVFENIIIAEGFRFNSDFGKISSTSWPLTFKGLFKHGVIGIGLPMILEYFWEFGYKDFFVKTKIFFSRLAAFFIFCSNSKKIKIQIGRNSEYTAQQILKYLDKYLLNSK